MHKKNASPFLTNIPTITDLRGNLGIIEPGALGYFDIKRVYYLFDVPHGQSRGGHAHYALQQLIICLSGSVKIRVETASGIEDFILDSPDKALYLGPMMWREMDKFSENCICVVLASLPYNEEDYIRDYSEFCAKIGK